MKINKYVRLIKNRGTGVWTNTKKDGVYLGTSASLYKADGLPIINETPQIQAVLDMDEKTKQKVPITIRNEQDKTDIMGFDLSDGVAAGEVSAQRIRVSAFIDGKLFTVLSCDDGEMLFFCEEFLNPLSDILKDEISYITYAVRHHRMNGNPYIVVKNGFLAVAMIMPVKVLNNDYISELQDFQLMCIDQLHRENAREILEEEKRMAEDGIQTSVDDLVKESEEGEEESGE